MFLNWLRKRTRRDNKERENIIPRFSKSKELSIYRKLVVENRTVEGNWDRHGNKATLGAFIQAVVAFDTDAIDSLVSNHDQKKIDLALFEIGCYGISLASIAFKEARVWGYRVFDLMDRFSELSAKVLDVTNTNDHSCFLDVVEMTNLCKHLCTLMQ